VDPINRVAGIYFLLLVLFRVAGARTLAQTTPFDLVLLLILSETTQQALVGDDHSFTQAATLVLTFIGIDVALSLLKQRSKTIGHLIEGRPVVLLKNGKPQQQQMDLCRIDEEDILEAARKSRGLLELKDIQLAVLERDGHVSIIPKPGSQAARDGPEEESPV
jgi:uncharacterized membrane protein YcaP (DUF421 family)